MYKIQLLIGGVDYALYIDMTTLHVDNNVVMTSDTATFTMQLDGELSRPKAGQEFIWKTVDSANNEISRDFGGVIVQVTEDTEGPSLIYTVTAKSYEHWLNRHLVTAWYNQATADVVVKEMLQQFCPDITVNNVQSTTAQIIPQYFNYQKPSDCLQIIADQLEFGWYVDYYKDLHFFPAEFFISPLPNNYLDVDNDLSSYGDLLITEDSEQVYNKVYLLGFKSRSNNYLNLSFPADGQTVQWSLGYRASSIKGDVSIGVFPSLSAYQGDTNFQTNGTVSASGAIQLKVAKDIVEGAPDMAAASGTGYIHYTQHLVRVPNAYGNGILPSGYVVGVHFYYLKDQIFMGQDSVAQSDIAKIEGTDGIYEVAYQDKSLTSSTISAAKSKAELVVRKYGHSQITGTFTSYLTGWRAGQYFNFKTTKRMGGINSVMYVMRVTKQLVKSVGGQFVLQNTVEFADSPYLV